MKNKLYVFDVFDTTLTRATGKPESLFYFLGLELNKKGLITMPPAQFAQKRVEAEAKISRNEKSPQAISLNNIYKQLQIDLNLPQEKIVEMARNECLTEASFIRGCDLLRRQITELREKGNRIMFVSEMYLPESFLKEQLIKHGIAQPHEECWVSCERGYSKSDGSLYRELMTRKGVQGPEVIYCGNDPQADVLIPRQFQIQTEPYLRANLNRYEQNLEKHAFVTRGFSSLLAGASRLTRLSIAPQNDREETIVNVTTGVAAPLLVSYVLWILWDARRKNLKRLYFVSRDGEILLKVAKKIVEKLGIKMELRYLYGSRQAWHLPGIFEMKEEDFCWAFDSPNHFTVNMLLNRLGFRPEDISAELESLGFPRAGWNHECNGAAKTELRNILRIPRVKKIILERAAEQRGLCKAYFQQEGLLDSGDWALVDLGWSGRMQHSLGKMLSTESKKIPMSYYFGLIENSLPDTYGKKTAYMFNEKTQTGFYALRNILIPLSELFASADHGLVLGYQKNKTVMEPILKERQNIPAVNWGIILAHKVVEKFTENLFLKEEWLDPNIDMRQVLEEQIRLFYFQPLPQEAQIYGEFPFETDQFADYYFPFAKAFSFREWMHSFFARKIKRHHAHEWVEGSLQLSPFWIRWLMKRSVSGVSDSTLK